MSKEITYFLEGRLIVIERFEDETDASYAERSSFILWFRNDPAKYDLAKTLSFYHANKIFFGVTYTDEVEKALQSLRDEISEKYLKHSQKSSKPASIRRATVTE
jgi:hypothetical protein